MLTVKDIMTREIVTISPESSIREATDKLLENSVSGLPVVDAAGNLVGIVTEFALLAMAYDNNVSDDFVAEHMTTDVLSINVSDPINKVADAFILHRVRRLPVMEDGRLVGLVARRDVLRALHYAEAPYAAC
ncbi:CBS domain-containing protein [Botrimarina mediterranea]|uniref:Hypoxic response protein 1 n=1 Tax=Botrimarina mediterranea TaxID=2528022 RepID=A0A518K8L6_9BACT|nr:CBS domain-containing protein [Botrimarina mediterranea]QDV74138.1 Hypoxic response protein 1 [Botrimarina mediterranea]